MFMFLPDRETGSRYVVVLGPTLDRPRHPGTSLMGPSHPSLIWRGAASATAYHGQVGYRTTQVALLGIALVCMFLGM